MIKKKFFVVSDAKKETEDSSENDRNPLDFHQSPYPVDLKPSESENSDRDTDSHVPEPQTELYPEGHDNNEDRDEFNTSSSDLEVIDDIEFRTSGLRLFRKQLTDVLGEVDDDVVESLYNKFFNQPNYLNLAVDEYLCKKSHKRKKSADNLVVDEVARSTDGTKSSEFKRFIGSLNMEAWATRPTTKILQFAEELELRKILAKGTKSGVTVRLFTVASGNGFSREIGRVSEEITRTIASLIDLGIAEFETTVMLTTTRRLSIGDCFYVQVNCFLKGGVFNRDKKIVARQVLSKKQKSFETSSAIDENEEELYLRQRKEALDSLFKHLNLNSVDSNGKSINHFPSFGEIKQVYESTHKPILDEIPEVNAPKNNFGLQLRMHQQAGLGWMLVREEELDVLEKLSDCTDISSQRRTDLIRQRDISRNPLWKKYRWPKGQSNSSENEDFFYANMHSGELSYQEPITKIHMKGGILGDEMGLGKTISTLALIASVPSDTINPFEKNYASRTTLIIVPMSLLSQWQKEFQRCNTNLNHKCIVYYGTNGETDRKVILQTKSKDVPVVMLTTYGTVMSEYLKHLKKHPDTIFHIKFFRIILDEAHTIRNRNTKLAKSIFELKLSRRWVLTGTPVMNRLDDIFSLVKFLRLEPWCNISYWRTFVTVPFEKKDIGLAFDVVKYILDPIFLRRTKDTKLHGGTPLVELPEKTVEFREIHMNKYEQRVYDWFRNRAHKSFDEGIKSGKPLANYSQILTYILRLRQICCHLQLVGKSPIDDSEQFSSLLIEDAKSNSDEEHASETIRELTRDKRDHADIITRLERNLQPQESECSICTECPIPIPGLVVSYCGHCFCRGCIIGHIQFQEESNQDPLCPVCRSGVSRDSLYWLLTKVGSDGSNFELQWYDERLKSSKVENLISYILGEMRDGEQLIVFSQFSSYLDIIELELRAQFGSLANLYKLHGKLSMKERQRILDSFLTTNTKNKKTILLLSLKTGGVGLNLTTCNRAILMDPWWLPNVEEQAIDRIHRIGQMNNVRITRYIMKNTIESKMLHIQERKRSLGAIVSSEEEQSGIKLEEIKILFE